MRQCVVVLHGDSALILKSSYVHNQHLSSSTTLVHTTPQGRVSLCSLATPLYDLRVRAMHGSWSIA
jgi:hypothetical protein